MALFLAHEKVFGEVWACATPEELSLISLCSILKSVWESHFAEFRRLGFFQSVAGR